jgi:hypothetical protein
MATHTPGPWDTTPVRDGRASITATLMDRVGTPEIAIAQVYDHIDVIDTEANARLIAAAPDLLQLVREARDFWDAEHPFDIRDWVKAADAAIAKVEGR